MKAIALIALTVIAADGGDCEDKSNDSKQAAEQEQALTQAQIEVGKPAITSFQELRMMKDLYELRDKAIATHAYIVNEMSGCLVYLGPAVGYGLPYATQFSSPEKDIYRTTTSSVHMAMPQAEPNGLFMPAAAEGTWVMLKDPAGDDVKPVYIEPRVIVSPFRLTAQECKEAPSSAMKK